MKIDHRGVPTLPMTLLRDAVAREVARQSLRHAAGQIALSPNGLRNFLNGAAPRSATRVKLERWLAAQQRVSRPPNVGQFVRLLGELAGDLSPQQTLALSRDVRSWLRLPTSSAASVRRPGCGIWRSASAPRAAPASPTWPENLPLAARPGSAYNQGVQFVQSAHP